MTPDQKTYYRLRDGVEVELVGNPEDKPILTALSQGSAGKWVRHPVHGVMLVGSEMLTEIVPPPPPMPDVPAFLLTAGVNPDNNAVASARVCWVGVWYGARMVKDPSTLGPTTWEQLHAKARREGREVIPLVPDPARGAPSLPYRIPADGDFATAIEICGRPERDAIAVHIKGYGGRQIPLEQAVEAARAVLRWAAEQQQVQQVQQLYSQLQEQQGGVANV